MLHYAPILCLKKYSIHVHTHVLVHTCVCLHGLIYLCVCVAGTVCLSCMARYKLHAYLCVFARYCVSAWPSTVCQHARYCVHICMARYMLHTCAFAWPSMVCPHAQYYVHVCMARYMLHTCVSAQCIVSWFQSTHTRALTLTHVCSHIHTLPLSVQT